MVKNGQLIKRCYQLLISVKSVHQQWHQKSSTWKERFKTLLYQQDFVDVTFVSEDNKEIKVVLSPSSPIFRSILLRNPYQNPLLFISGVQHLELKSLLNFMYLGQIEVAQDDLNSFMAIASKFLV